MKLPPKIQLKINLHQSRKIYVPIHRMKKEKHRYNYKLVAAETDVHNTYELSVGIVDVDRML